MSVAGHTAPACPLDYAAPVTEACSLRYAVAAVGALLLLEQPSVARFAWRNLIAGSSKGGGLSDPVGAISSSRCQCNSLVGATITLHEKFRLQFTSNDKRNIFTFKTHLTFANLHASFVE